jgi:hypothetical protein
MEFDTLLAAVSVVIILGLAFYAGILISRIKMHSEQNEQRQKQLQAEQQQRNAKICESIRIIARATVQKQCNLSEAAIRLTILLETLLVDKAIDIESEYPALSELFAKVKNMPTHELRKKVAIKELKELDKQRLLFETELEERIIKEASQLVNFSV